MAVKRSPLLLKLMARAGELDFEECWIPSVNGCKTLADWSDKGRIRVNPMPHVVDSVIHELLHEACPTYSERAVRSMTGKLMKQLSDEEIQAIYAEFRRRVD